ncbi:MAG: hypothetical protein BWX88_05285 [Planctomycetes bacterium ADurb.Bin126]|nr:MAG: hypothetical protein BWX88_05285 [Planctomycetes bacterium ADurb.Bin126]
MLKLAAGRDQLVLVLADQPVGGHRLEVIDVPHRADVPPGPLHAEEALQQKLVGHVGQDARDVDGRVALGLDAVGEGEPQDRAAVAEVAALVAVGPGRLQQEFLEPDAAAEPVAGQLGRLLAVAGGHVVALHPAGEHAGGLQDGAGDVVVPHVGGRGLGPVGPQDLQLRLGHVPALADGLGGDLGVLVAADLPHGRDPLLLGGGAGTHVGDGVGREPGIGGGLDRGPAGLRAGAGLGLDLGGILALLGLGGSFGAGAGGVGNVHVLLLGRSGHTGRRVAVGAQVDKADLPQRRPADDVQGAGEVTTVHRDGLVLLDEFELLDPRADGGLPGEAVAGRDDDLAGGGRVARDDARGDELAVLDADGVGVSDAAVGVVAESDGPGL